ncbi:MAG: aminotransferase class III-fold pyridoxal phosphate-dependent enzyme [Magnetococcales bacterium]|nr:aminotransferase class III-fold pyridoxal phosphate-dependent enzyme [Magnetococcales bacterium]
MVNRPHQLRLGSYKQQEDFSYLRWTVDEPEDFELVEEIYSSLYHKNPYFCSKAILDLLKKRPHLSSWNTQYQRNAGLAKSLEQDQACQTIHGYGYKTSEALLDRALQSIPLGSQTFSKSLVQFPHGVSPFFVTHGKGSRLWDVDGNEYIDFINGLHAVSLGYHDLDVVQAVRNQLNRGSIFSLPHTLEMEVAEKIIAMVPCAEMVRFGKNGSDATAGAIRLARAYTDRDHVAVCGYHGWQDWYIGSTLRNLGVPKSTRALTHTFTYNDVDSLHKIFTDYPCEIAAVILEPVNVELPRDGFLETIREITRQHGTVLIFDETITGFRLAPGGAQEYFGVIPDLATLGKGLSNGYPLSAIAGRRDIMRLMEEIFFSFTFGGETLSLAAASATLNKLQQQPVVATLWQRGHQLLEGLAALLKKHAVEHFLTVAGLPVWSFLIFRDARDCTQWEIKSLFMQEIFSRGILCLGTHNISYSHTIDDIDYLLSVYDAVFPILKDAVDNGKMKQTLRCQPIQPLFRVRS